MQKTIKIGCEIFVTKGNTLLLLGKRKNCFGEGTWGLPGGHLEYGESLIHGAQRELKEEVGIDCPGLKLIAIGDDINEQSHYIHVSFLAENFTGEVTLMEPEFCYEWKFFDIDNLPTEIFKPHQQLLKTYFSKTLYLENPATFNISDDCSLCAGNPAAAEYVKDLA